MTTGNRPFWPVFVWTSSLLSLSGGFLLGGLIFLLRSTDRYSANWQIGAIQAHGHVQLFGWGGLMVLGIGLHFLPRLLSAPLRHPQWPRLILALMTAGLVLRLVSGPMLETFPRGISNRLAAAGLMLSATLELVAICLALSLVGSMIRRAHIKKRGIPSRGVTALILFAFTSLGAAMFMNVAGTIDVWLRSLIVVPYWADSSTVTLALTGFLTAISIAMSARLLPLYVHVKAPREGWMRAVAALLPLALVTRVIGIVTQNSASVGTGLILQSSSLVCGVIALRVFERRRTLPRQRVTIFTDPLQLMVLSAYCWLVAAVVFGLMIGANDLGLGAFSVPLDAERHALGAGFVTLLILGIGSEMLPGLGKARLRRPELRWVTLILANVSALLRTVPLLLDSTPGARTSAIMSGAGLLGALAIVVFLVNIRPGLRAKFG